jgi:hypothetical protein
MSNKVPRHSRSVEETICMHLRLKSDGVIMRKLTSSAHLYTVVSTCRNEANLLDILRYTLSSRR